MPQDNCKKCGTDKGLLHFPFQYSFRNDGFHYCDNCIADAQMQKNEGKCFQCQEPAYIIQEFKSAALSGLIVRIALCERCIQEARELRKALIEEHKAKQIKQMKQAQELRTMAARKKMKRNVITEQSLF